MKKVLFVATVLKGHILKFHKPYLKWFKDKGFEVWVSSKNDTNSRNIKIDCIDYFVEIPFERNPFSINNIKAYYSLKKLILEEDFQVIHCHTPVAGVITRLVKKLCDIKNTTFIYTAHGFHFYKGSPLINWIFFYPIEYYLSKNTDVLITINKEDYILAKKNFKMKKLFLVNGVGVDFSDRKNSDHTVTTREDLGFGTDDFILFSIGELNRNKNHKIIIDAINCEELKNIKYIIAGDGKLMSFYNNYINEKKISDRVKFLGYRSDILDLLKLSNVFVFPSLREGLPVSVMEAQHCGLPCIVSDIRGNNDLIEDNVGGFLCKNTVFDYRKSIIKLINEKELLKKFSTNNLENHKKYNIQKVLKEYENIYLQVISI